MNTKSTNFCKLFRILLVSILLTLAGGGRLYAQYYPVHATVQWPSPQSPYLSDYYSGSRDRLIVTLLNRDLQQPLLFAKLRIKIKSTGFLASSREEVSYPILELNANVPTRLTNIDLAPYLQPQNLQTNGNLRNGQLPVGYTEFSVQVIDYYTGRALSDWHSGRSYLDVKKPPLLNFPEKDAQIGITEPLYIRFQWMPRHQGLAGTEYEFVLKELPDNGAAPQAAFAYGNEIYRIRTRNTTLNYTHLEPVLFPNRRYAWQVQAIARDGVDEVGMFENGGFSEINWFYLNDNCQAPTGLKALPRFAKVELSWNKVIGTTGYVVECRPKTKLNVYEWSSTRVAGEYLTLAQLKPGWTYEWRVGTLCTDDRPVFSGVHEFTLSSQNDELLADCGKEPVRSDLSQEPNLRIKAGDIVTIGGDYPMTIIEAVSLGDGWYSGRGKTRLKTIIDAPVALRFDRLRINVDNFQIDGTIEASYDEKKGKTANLDYVDDGGKDIKPATIRIREHKLDFTLPDLPQFTYNPTTGEIETTDAEGNPQTVKIDVPENASYESIFPILVTDKKGNTYQISPAGQNAEKGTGNDVENGNKDGKIELTCERVDRVGDFNTESLSSKYGYVHFERGEGKYAFDNGQEKWYKKSVKTDRFYKPFAKGYIAPWKLVPTGENDIVTARYDGLKNIDLKKVRFVSEPNSAALPARLNETEQTWSITLKPVATGASYDVFAVYEGVVIGKLRVVSYARQQHKVTLVPINEVRLDKTAIEQELNAIYNPVGVQFTVNVDERMRGNYDWEVESEKDGLLSTVGKSFWGYDKELKESTEMLNLQKTYQQAVGTLDGAYLFVLNGATGLEGQKNSLLGEMPRKSRFGYIFCGGSPNTEEVAHTIAHEIGHGIFTLQHTFDSEYGKDTQGGSNNLLDYPNNPLDYKEKTELAAFQWNVMANPAIFTAMDKAKDGEIILKEGEFLGFTPDGRVIQARPEDYVGIFDNASTYFIYAFKDNKGTFYKWNRDKKIYINDNGGIFKVPDVKVTGKVAIWRNSSNPQCYVWYKFLDVRNYTSAQFEQIKQRIAKDDGSQWELDLVEGANASPACKDAANAENEKLASLQSFIHFTEHANISRFQILSELAKVFQTNRKNTLTDNKEFDKDRVIIISIEGYDDNEIKELKSKCKKYLHFIFSNENGTIKFSRIESPDEFIDKLSHISELIKDKPWAAQAIVLYEVADLLDKGIEYLKIPESVWGCNTESNVYKDVIIFLLNTQGYWIVVDKLSGGRFSDESKFAFVCGLWNGTVDIIQSVPKLAKLLTCAFHEDCAESVSSQWESFKSAVIKDENGNILCQQDEYLCKAKHMIGTALEELVEDDCKLAHTVGSVVGPVVALTLGDYAAAPGLLETLGTVGSGLKYAVQGLQFCDKVTNITGQLAKGLKATTVLIKKAGKLVPELHIGDNITLHIDEDKWFLRNPKVDAGHATAVDESNLAQKIEDALSADMKGVASAKLIRSLSNNKSFMDVLKGVRIKGKPIELEDLAKMFEDLHTAVPPNSVKPLKDVVDDFVYLVDHHLSDLMKTRDEKPQIVRFLNELLQSKDKFKAGTTTLEVIHNAQKYIPSKYYNTLSTLQLEELIAYADDAGDFRFDIKWSALAPETNKPISVFIDTKNYSSASNMFKDLGQFKAYLGAIDNFDNLYIIQQGGRGVTREQIINRLKNVLNKGKNKDEVFEIIWNNETLRKNVFGQISNPDFKVQAKLLFVSKINNKTLDIFNSILITK